MVVRVAYFARVRYGKVRVGSRSGELIAVGIGELGSRLQVVLVSG